MKERRERKRDHARKTIEKCDKDLQEVMMVEQIDISVLMDDVPLDGLGLPIEHFNNDGLADVINEFRVSWK